MFQFPPSPTVGQVFNPAPGINFRWNGTAWFPVGPASGGIVISDTEPVPVLQPGEQWWESDTAGFYMKYQNPDGTFTLVSLAGAGGDFIPMASAPTLVPESRIINGGFAIDQRNAGASYGIASTSMYTLDRWTVYAAGSGSLFVQRGTPPYLAAVVNATDTTIGAGDIYAVGQLIEGFQISDMAWGSASAVACTLAFNALSTVACTLPVSFRNDGGTHSYIKTMTLPANVLTPITMTIPGPTSGTWVTGNGTGIRVLVSLATGSNAPAADSWQSGNFTGVAGCTNLMASAATLQLHNVRLYPGSIDYGPCRRLYAEELRLCQRYYQKSYDLNFAVGSNSNNGMVVILYPAASAMLVPIEFSRMRGAPQITFYEPTTGATGVWRNLSAGTPITTTAYAWSETNVIANPVSAPATTIVGGHWTASAEL